MFILPVKQDICKLNFKISLDLLFTFRENRNIKTPTDDIFWG